MAALKRDKKHKPKNDNWKFYAVLALIILYGTYFTYFGSHSKWRWLAVGIIHMIWGLVFLIRQIKRKKEEKKKLKEKELP